MSLCQMLWAVGTLHCIYYFQGACSPANETGQVLMKQSIQLLHWDCVEDTKEVCPSISSPHVRAAGTLTIAFCVFFLHSEWKTEHESLDAKPEMHLSVSVLHSQQEGLVMLVSRCSRWLQWPPPEALPPLSSLQELWRVVGILGERSSSSHERQSLHTGSPTLGQVLENCLLREVSRNMWQMASYPQIHFICSLDMKPIS